MSLFNMTENNYLISSIANLTAILQFYKHYGDCSSFGTFQVDNIANNKVVYLVIFRQNDYCIKHIKQREEWKML